jgi:Mg-chelatase subunit ChlD
MHWRSSFFIGLALAMLVVVGAFKALAVASPIAQDEPQTSNCQFDLGKYVDPDRVLLGDASDVTLVVSGTCPGRPLPVDLVLLADESTSMGKRQGGRPGEPLPTKPMPTEGTPDPSAIPPTKTPAPGAERTPGPGAEGGEPPFCNPGGGHERTPTATPTRWMWKTPTPEDRLPRPTPIGEYAGTKDQIREIQSWVNDFVSRPEIQADFASGRLRAGFVSFNTRARIRQGLSPDPGRLVSSVRRLRASGETRINQGLRDAERILNGSGARPDEGQGGRIKIVVILSDFQFCQRDMRKLSGDVNVFAVGFGVRQYDRPKLAQLATTRTFVSEQHQLKDTMQGYSTLARGGRAVTVDQLQVRDELDERLTLLPDSVDPPTVTISGQILQWQLKSPTLPMTLSYSVRPMATGIISVSKSAGIVWTDSEGAVGSAPFPDARIEVIALTPTSTPTSTFTPTPTPTLTPTATPTPTPGDLFLPITHKLWPKPEPTPTVCKPELQTVDIALVIDTSISMGDPTQAGGKPKLQAAIEAAEELTRMLKPTDQAAVVGFNSTSTLATVLTNDRERIAAALRSLPATQAQGTSIDIGLLAGLSELESERHIEGNHRSIILVTDGHQTGPGGNRAVRDAAIVVEGAGVQLIVIGLGSDVDEPLLRSIVSEPELYFRAPNAEDLLAVYREIARYIPCP